MYWGTGHRSSSSSSYGSSLSFLRSESLSGDSVEPQQQQQPGSKQPQEQQQQLSDDDDEQLLEALLLQGRHKKKKRRKPLKANNNKKQQPSTLSKMLQQQETKQQQKKQDKVAAIAVEDVANVNGKTTLEETVIDATEEVASSSAAAAVEMVVEPEIAEPEIEAALEEEPVMIASEAVEESTAVFEEEPVMIASEAVEESTVVFEEEPVYITSEVEDEASFVLEEEHVSITSEAVEDESIAVLEELQETMDQELFPAMAAEEYEPAGNGPQEVMDVDFEANEPPPTRQQSSSYDYYSTSNQFRQPYDDSGYSYGVSSDSFSGKKLTMDYSYDIYRPATTPSATSSNSYLDNLSSTTAAANMETYQSELIVDSTVLTQEEQMQVQQDVRLAYDMETVDPITMPEALEFEAPVQDLAETMESTTMAAESALTEIESSSRAARVGPKVYWRVPGDVAADIDYAALSEPEPIEEGEGLDCFRPYIIDDGFKSASLVGDTLDTLVEHNTGLEAYGEMKFIILQRLDDNNRNIQSFEIVLGPETTADIGWTLYDADTFVGHTEIESGTLGGSIYVGPDELAEVTVISTETTERIGTGTPVRGAEETVIRCANRGAEWYINGELVAATPQFRNGICANGEPVPYVGIQKGTFRFTNVELVDIPREEPKKQAQLSGTVSLESTLQLEEPSEMTDFPTTTTDTFVNGFDDQSTIVLDDDVAVDTVQASQPAFAESETTEMEPETFSIPVDGEMNAATASEYLGELERVFSQEVEEIGMAGSEQISALPDDSFAFPTDAFAVDGTATLALDELPVDMTPASLFDPSEVLELSTEAEAPITEFNGEELLIASDVDGFVQEAVLGGTIDFQMETPSDKDAAPAFALDKLVIESGTVEGELSEPMLSFSDMNRVSDSVSVTETVAEVPPKKSYAPTGATMKNVTSTGYLGELEVATTASSETVLKVNELPRPTEMVSLTVPDPVLEFESSVATPKKSYAPSGGIMKNVTSTGYLGELEVPVAKPELTVDESVEVTEESLAAFYSDSPILTTEPSVTDPVIKKSYSPIGNSLKNVTGTGYLGELEASVQSESITDVPEPTLDELSNLASAPGLTTVSSSELLVPSVQEESIFAPAENAKSSMLKEILDSQRWDELESAIAEISEAPAGDIIESSNVTFQRDNNTEDDDDDIKRGGGPSRVEAPTKEVASQHAVAEMKPRKTPLPFFMEQVEATEPGPAFDIEIPRPPRAELAKSSMTSAHEMHHNHDHHHATAHDASEGIIKRLEHDIVGVGSTLASGVLQKAGDFLLDLKKSKAFRPVPIPEAIPEDDSPPLDTHGMTERIMKRLPVEIQTAGAGGATTWDAFQKAENNWTELKKSTTFRPRSMTQAPQFVVTDGALGNPKCWERLREQRNTKLDYDIVVCGGTLGIFFATALQVKGLRVAVVEAGELRGREQEWNISMDELLELKRLGVLSQDDIDAAIKTEFPGCRAGFKNAEVTPLKGGYFDNGIGYECFAEDVLNLGVSPAVLIERVSKTFEDLGGVIREQCPLKGITLSENFGSALDLGSEMEPITTTLLLDCMGNASPITRQQRWGMKPDGVCAVVGSCAAGYDKESNLFGDIIYTNTEIQNKGDNGQLQYFWEAFPVGIGRDGKEPGSSDVKTTYMFTYMDASEKRPSLESLMEDYWRLLPKYQKSIKNPETDLDIKRVLFAYFPTYRDSPLKPQWDRVLAVGDASGIQSPLSFGGFGALTRHLDRISTSVVEAIQNDLLSKEELGEINAYTPNLSAAWMFQKAMSVRMKQKVAPQFVNRLLATNFEVMDGMGTRTIKPFLQDVVRFDSLVGSLAKSFQADPLFMPEIVKHVGIPTLVEWVGHVGMMGVYGALDTVVSPVLSPIVNHLDDPKERFHWRRRMEAWKYGSGHDYVLPKKEQ
jgi:hypothetical protein